MFRCALNPCLVAIIAALLLAFANPAVASFGDCEDPGYLGLFGGATNPAPPMGTGCAVAFDIPFTSPEGPRRIRAIHDLSAGWLVSDASLAALEAGVRDAIRAFGPLGAYAIDDVTILILEGNDLRLSDPASSTDGTLAGTDVSRRPDGSRWGECLITLFAFQAVGMDPENTGYVIAHELFHCIQAATFTDAQLETTTGGGAWWAEGSAELFAALATTGDTAAADRSRRFARAVEERVPLNNLTYAMAVFFWWLNDARGTAGIIPFLHQMASSGDESAQRAAMRSALPPADWLRFAQDYVDHDIPHPNGAGLTYATGEGDEHVFEQNRTAWLTLEPFVLTQAAARYGCGEWFNEGAPTHDTVAAREAAGRDWGRYPSDVNAREGRPGRYRIAAINTGDSQQRVPIEAERRVACGPCAGSERVDACLVGTWVQSGGGALEWMQSQGMPITRATASAQIITYIGDGSYQTLPFSVELVEEFQSSRGRTIGEGVGGAQAAFGRWSADAGMLNICQGAGGVSGTVTITSPSGTGTMPIDVPGGGQISMSYSCSETTLQTSMDFGSLPPMVTQFSKISADPPDEDPPPPPASGGGETTHLTDRSAASCPAEDPDPTVEDECDRARR